MEGNSFTVDISISSYGILLLWNEYTRVSYITSSTIDVSITSEKQSQYEHGCIRSFIIPIRGLLSCIVFVYYFF